MALPVCMLFCIYEELCWRLFVWKVCEGNRNLVPAPFNYYQHCQPVVCEHEIVGAVKLNRFCNVSLCNTCFKPTHPARSSAVSVWSPGTSPHLLSLATSCRSLLAGVEGSSDHQATVGEAHNRDAARPGQAACQARPRGSAPWHALVHRLRRLLGVLWEVHQAWSPGGRAEQVRHFPKAPKAKRMDFPRLVQEAVT